MIKEKKKRKSCIVDITGKKFGKLTVIKLSHVNKHRQSMWECLCLCGNRTFVTKGALNRGSTKSCGCSIGPAKGTTPWNKGKKIQTNTGKTHFKKGLKVWNKGVPYIEIQGEKHWNWKGGISTENDKIRKSPEYKEWRNAVYKRDNWTCQKCKEKLNNKNIVAHHIKSFSKFIKLRFVVSNGRTLCRKCHCKLHKKDLKA